MHRRRLLTVLALLGCLAGPLLQPAAAQMAIPPHSLEDVVDRAQAEQTPILIEIYAPWCPYCERMQETVYADEQVQEYLDTHFTHVRLNSDTSGATHRFQGRTLSTSELASALGARGVPTTVFMTADGAPIARQPGLIKRPLFLQMIRYIGSGAYRNQDFKTFAEQPSR
jgi:thioredoxin-related protein